MSKKITIEEFEKRIKVRFPKESFMVIKYEGLGKPAIIKCNTCGKELTPSKASNFMIPTKVYGCVNCHGLWKDREKKLNNIKEKYDIIETFVKETHTYYTIKCKNCGHERTSTLSNLYKHLDCGCLTGVYRNRTDKEFIDTVNKYCEDEGYELISEYKN